MLGHLFIIGGVEMVILIRIIGILLVALGFIFSLKPDLLKRVISYFVVGKRAYQLGILRILMAIIFLLSASGCRIPELMIILGFILLFSGIMIFIFGLERTKKFLTSWQDKPVSILRLLGILQLIFGILILYSA